MKKQIKSNSESQTECFTNAESRERNIRLKIKLYNRFVSESTKEFYSHVLRCEK